MTINQQLSSIFDELEKMHRAYSDCFQQLKELNSRFDELQKKVYEDYQKSKTENEKLLDQISNYYDIVSDCTSKKKRTSSLPAAPDFERLSDLLSEVDLNASDDQYADKIVDLVCQNIAFVTIKNKKLDEKKEISLSRLSVQRANEEALIKQRIKIIKTKCSAYLTSKEIKSLYERFHRLKQNYAITEETLTQWTEAYHDEGSVLIGFYSLLIDIPNSLKETFNNSMHGYYRIKENTLIVPCGYNMWKSPEVICEYSELNEDLAKKGIQTIILNYLRHFKLSHIKISVIDYVYYSTDIIGSLRVFTKSTHSPIDDIPGNEKELKRRLETLVNYYKTAVWPKIGNETVHEYNRHVEEAMIIPYRVIILIQSQDSSGFTEDANLSYLKNNAAKLGICIISLLKCYDGGSKGTKKEQKYIAKANEFIRVITDKEGHFYIDNDGEWLPFRWLRMPVKYLPTYFVDNVIKLSEPLTLGTKYFNRYKFQIPVRSSNKRRVIKTPFAIRQDDTVVECSFENELFAAFIMGASRSGKTTLLHTIITGLITNYHPDELELWLCDFKMVEFATYIKHTPPHVKYVLLQNSIDLVYDVVNKMLDIMHERKYIFSQHGWKKLLDVPMDVYMPAIFVIIDEFSDMSDILKETKGAGRGADYTAKVAELLREGAALGFQFIFASQTYVDGVGGLTEQAKKQIQQRIALKNNAQEIKETLSVTSDMLTPDISDAVHTLPPFESIFKWRDDGNNIHIEHLRNMYVEEKELIETIDKVTGAFYPINKWGNLPDNNYYNKNPILIDGGTPKTYIRELIRYREYEEKIEEQSGKLRQGEYYIYPGVPCSFDLVKPFMLNCHAKDNILLLGGKEDQAVSVLLSIMHSFKSQNSDIQIWSNERDPIIEKYSKNALKDLKIVSSLKDICVEIKNTKINYERRQFRDRLIVVLGYEYLASEMELTGADAEKVMHDIRKEGIIKEVSIQDVSKQLATETDPDEKKRIIEAYNKHISDYNNQQSLIKANDGVYDARNDMQYIVSRTAGQGTHFMFYYSYPSDCKKYGIKPDFFKHKITFSISPSDAIEFLGNRMASTISADTCLYSDGKTMISYKPHLHNDVLLNGWSVMNNGQVVYNSGNQL